MTDSKRLSNLTSIACIGNNFELGKGSDLVWWIPEDLKSFKDLTMGKYVLMGEKTYHTLPPKLEGRRYLVLSHDLKDGDISNAKIFNSLEQFIEFARNVEKQGEEICVIGGGMIYKLLLPYVFRMILTEVDGMCDDATIFYPEFDKDEWSVESSESFVGTDKHTGEELSYKRVVYVAN